MNQQEAYDLMNQIISDANAHMLSDEERAQRVSDLIDSVDGNKEAEIGITKAIRDETLVIVKEAFAIAEGDIALTGVFAEEIVGACTDLKAAERVSDFFKNALKEVFGNGTFGSDL